MVVALALADGLAQVVGLRLCALGSRLSLHRLPPQLLNLRHLLAHGDAHGVLLRAKLGLDLAHDIVHGEGRRSRLSKATRVA